jgi:U2-associated protein SR140
MASDKKKIDQFPDVGNKLQAPSKKSLFERQKADAEAKRLREEAETKAVYDDFVKSFDDEDEDSVLGGRGFGGDSSRGGFGMGGFSGGPPKRHYSSAQGAGMGMGAPTGPTVGRGLGFGGDRAMGGGSGPGSLGPPPLKKRAFDGFQQQQRRDDRGLLAFDDYEQESAPSKVLKALDDDDDRRGGIEEEKAAAKPTMRLASLPPGTSPAFIKALLPSNLTVDAVRIQAPTGPGVYSERKSMSAIITLAKDTAANDIDAAVNLLQNKYLGYGYYLNLHRHLSSAAISSAAPVSGLGSSTTAQPFGAKPVSVAPAGRGHAPPLHQRGGFAPPASYTPTGPGQLSRGGPLLHVPVQAPRDIKELKLIHKVIEALLTHGPEFEALLMSRPDIQREEKWAWLWDARSTGGIWYRWRLWEVLTGTQTRRGQGKYLPLFESSSAWKAPDQPLVYEYTTRLDEFVSDSEYFSSDEDDSGDEGARRQHGGGAPPDPSALVDDGKAYLNPLEKAKLTHLLSRLPTSTGKLRKGDVARVTAFAISHAGRGADEVVAAIISNIEKPFAFTSANPDRRKDKDMSGDDTPANEDEEKSDTSSASLIGIYLISDILSSSSTSGVRHAWRYRQLFEQALKQKHVFEGLGRMERKMNWGRMRAEKWKRSVAGILSLWEGWCVFPQESQEHFVNVFNNPPMTAKEEREAKEHEAEVVEKGKSRWKAVEVAPTEVVKAEVEVEVDGEAMEEDADVDGEPMEEDDLDGEPMEDEDVDGVFIDDENEGEPMEEDEAQPPISELPQVSECEPKASLIPAKVDPAPVGQTRRRPRAVDMFADSDDED